MKNVANQNLTIVNALIAHRFSLTPVKYGQKAPLMPQWQKKNLSPDEMRHLFSNGVYNIGIKNGDASAGNIDVDLDCWEAVKLAEYILPETPFVFGRTSRPRSHFMYRCDGELPSTKQHHDGDGRMLAECRTDGSMTVAPGSIHPCGETYEGEIDLPPAMISDAEALFQDVSLIAAAAILLRAYPKEGGRQDFALTVGGAFARFEFPEERTKLMMTALANASEDEEAQKRVQCVSDSYSAYRRNDKCYGYASLAEKVGKREVAAIMKILNLSARRVTSRSRGGAESGDVEGVSLSREGTVLNTRQNVAHLLREAKWQGCLGYDLRAGHSVFLKAPPFKTNLSQYPAPLADIDVLRIGQQTCSDHGVSFSTSHLREGIELVCREREFDEVADYLERVEAGWDGQPRLETMLVTYFKVEDTPYSRKVALW